MITNDKLKADLKDTASMLRMAGKHVNAQAVDLAIERIRELESDLAEARNSNARIRVQRGGS